jgi:hypothetical protein
MPKNKVRMIRIKMSKEKEKRIREMNKWHAGSVYDFGYHHLCKWQYCVCGRIYDYRWAAQNCKHKETVSQKIAKRILSVIFGRD